MKALPIICVTALLLAGCNSDPPRAPAIGEAFAGPGNLTLRRDIPLRSPAVTTVKHGEHLEILQRRRRFVKVRTAALAEGWVDERLLLSPQQLAGLRALSEHSKSAPSQGAATTYDTLNVHTEPDRQSPSFQQVKEGEKVDVIGRRVAPRNTPPPPSSPPAPAAPVRTKKKKKAPPVPPPPKAAAPKPPPDWLQLSTSPAPPVTAPAPEPKPVPMDDWSLVRNAAGQTGWVLTRRLAMAIPDDVAQYAEGRRIVSYFQIGETRDGKITKPSWLWTTVEEGLTPYDFDSFRVFVWSLRRHRYETARIERNLKGFFPVLTNPAGFSIIVEKKDGLRYRRNFSFANNTVRPAGEQRVETPPAQTAPQPNPSLIAAVKPEPAEESFYGGLKDRIKRLLGR